MSWSTVLLRVTTGRFSNAADQQTSAHHCPVEQMSLEWWIQQQSGCAGREMRLLQTRSMGQPLLMSTKSTSTRSSSSCAHRAIASG